MKNYTKTRIFTISLAVLTIILAAVVQLKGESLVFGCSYLDPITIDLLAFAAALFLVVEGMYRIYEHKDAPLKKQVTRAVRIAFGCAILTLHVLQFVHK